jgi:hypothetical protein
MIKRYIVSKNNKLMSYCDDESEYLDVIRRDFNEKKADVYGVEDLEKSVCVCVSECVSQLKWESRRKKKCVSRPKVKKGDIIDDKYSKWLAAQPCVITGATTASRGIGPNDMHCHHIHGRGRGRNDHLQVPMMGFVHSWGPTSYHSIARSDFITVHGLCVDNIIEYFEDCSNEFLLQYSEANKNK